MSQENTRDYRVSHDPSTALKAAVTAAHPEVPVEAIETLESLRARKVI